jgi:hypothetical protein
MQIRADHTSCVDDKHKPYSKCCPAGFSAVGAFADHGEDNTVCLENSRSNRAVIKLKYDAKGKACIAANTISATCCPDGYKAVGVYSDAATHNIVCLETKGSGRSWYQIAFPPDMSANCNSAKCCPKGYSYVGFYADGKNGYQNGTCLQDP